MRVLSSPPDQTAGPALRVETTPSSLNWTPVHARASLATRVGCAADGDLTWREDTNAIMGREDGKPQLRVRGDLELEDTTRGVISRPAYHRHLARQVAAAVGDIVKAQVIGE